MQCVGALCVIALCECVCGSKWLIRIYATKELCNITVRVCVCEAFPMLRRVQLRVKRTERSPHLYGTTV